jgi:hypothetical protein
MPPLTEASFLPPGGALPQVTRSRESQERKREKPRGKSHKKPQKREKPAKRSRLASTFATLAKLGKALEERTRWGRRHERPPATQAKNETVDNEVLSEIFSKFGLETKIDKIEAEFDAEAKVARAAARSKISAPVTSTATKSSAPEKQLPSHFDVYGKPADRHHKLWMSAICVLGIILVVQSAFLARNRIARAFPSTRPALVSLCETLGCAMPLPRDASQIKVTYGLNQRSENRYVFYATVTNNADFAQDWPNLGLTLHNFIEQPLSSRIFTPTEWAPPENLAQNTGIAPKSSVTTQLELEIAGAAPSRFKLEHSYP